MSIHDSIQQLKPNLFRKTFGQNEYDELMHVFDRLMRENLDDANKEKLTEFINDGIDKIYIRFDNDTPIHPETLNILIRAIQVYNHNHTIPYRFRKYDGDPHNMTVHFMNNVVRKAAKRNKPFVLTRGAYTKTQLDAQSQHGTDMKEVDGGAKRKRTKRRHKRKQRKSKRVKKVIH